MEKFRGFGLRTPAPKSQSDTLNVLAYTNCQINALITLRIDMVIKNVLAWHFFYLPVRPAFGNMKDQGMIHRLGITSVDQSEPTETAERDDYKNSKETGLVASMKLAPGNYQIYSFAAENYDGHTTTTFYPRKRFSIPFTVAANTVTYPLATIRQMDYLTHN